MSANDKRKEKWIKKYKKYKEFQREINQAASDILNSYNFNSTKEHIQHGTMTVNGHCMNVARTSLKINELLKLRCEKRELIRGALLHDYFLYDWHTGEHVKLYNLHGYHHPSIALKNALKEYDLTDREKDIIKKHMWPLTIWLPMCREAWVVTTADKYCSLMETFKIQRGHGAIPLSRVYALQKGRCK